jgi:hypothetical protein
MVFRAYLKQASHQYHPQNSQGLSPPFLVSLKDKSFIFQEDNGNTISPETK